MIYDLVREALFNLDAERSHDLTLGLLSRFPALALPPGSRGRRARPARAC